MNVGAARDGRETSPIVLVVAEEFRSLMDTLTWLHEAGYDVRACLGPLAADRFCGLFEGGCGELAECDLLITNDRPHPSRLLPPSRDVVTEARLRREELPILVVDEEGLEDGDTVRSVTGRLVAPHKADVMAAVEALVGPATGGGDK